MRSRIRNTSYLILLAPWHVACFILLGVKLLTISKHLHITGRFAAVAVMLSLWLGMCVLEVSPDLHNFIHRDAQSPVHNCLVTQFQHHSVHSAFVPVCAPVAPANFSLLVAVRDFKLSASFDYRLSPSRAPPTV
jgi:hypothetical protein